jgi:PKD repeat protein
MKRMASIFLVLIIGFGLTACFPKAKAGADKQILSDLSVTLDGSGSTVLLGKINTYTWDFGDGTQATGAVVTHKYSAAGNYTVTLTILDNTKQKSTDTATVQVVTWDTLATPITADGHIIEAPLIDFLPDGRMIVAEGNSSTEIEIAVETAAGNKEFKYLTSLTTESVPPLVEYMTYGSFIKVVDADTVLVGASEYIYEIKLNPVNVILLAEIGNCDAVLFENALYVTRSEYNPDWSSTSYVSRIDLDNPSIHVDLITGITGASAGVCTDDEGNIYTGNGYTNYGLDETGLIKRFAIADLPLSWSAGTGVGDVLSAGSLIWAGGGIILVGGGDTFGSSGDFNYFTALDTTTGTKLWELDPDPAGSSYYKLNANAGRFAASIWNYTPHNGTIFLLPYAALGF